MDFRIYKGSFGVGSVTASAGTAFTAVIPPGGPREKARITKLIYTAGNTAHSVNILKCQHKTMTTAAANASQADIVLDDLTSVDQANGVLTTETLAASDWLVIKHSDGTFGAYSVSSVSGSTVTLSSNLVKSVDANATVYKMHELARPASGKGFPAQVLVPPASATTSIGSENPHAAVAVSRFGEPLLIHSDNSSHAGTLVLVQGVYSSI